MYLAVVELVKTVAQHSSKDEVKGGLGEDCVSRAVNVTD